MATAPLSLIVALATRVQATISIDGVHFVPRDAHRVIDWVDDHPGPLTLRLGCRTYVTMDGTTFIRIRGPRRAPDRAPVASWRAKPS